MKRPRFEIGPVSCEGRTKTLAQVAALLEAAAILEEVDRGPLLVVWEGEIRLAAREPSGWAIYVHRDGKLDCVGSEQGRRAAVDASLRFFLAQKHWKLGDLDAVDAHPLLGILSPFEDSIPKERADAQKEFASWCRGQLAYRHYFDALRAAGFGQADADSNARRIMGPVADSTPERYGVPAWVDPTKPVRAA